MKLNILTAITIATGLLASCQLAGSIDDIKPHYKLESETVIRDAESAENALRGIYEGWRLRGVSTPRMHISLLAGGLIRTGNISGEQGFVNNDLLPTNITLNEVYQEYYRIINTANNFISLMEQGRAVKMPEKRVMEVIAEAKIQRALAHFHLLRYFGYFFDNNSALGIVLRDKAFEGLAVSKRSSVADSYSFILADLDFGIQHAPSSNELHYYMSQVTAKALKAKVLLHLGDYPKAEQLAQEVLTTAGAAGYRLSDNYADIFLNGFNASEVLFATYNYGTLESAQVSVERTTASAFSKNIADLLPDNSLNGNGNTGAGYDSRYAYMYALASRGPLLNGKYPYGANALTQRNSHILLRLGEIYLIHAEAAARNKNFAAAKESLQLIATRAGYAADYTSSISNAELLISIFNHKWLELLSENGEDWFDFIRFYKQQDIPINYIKASITREEQLVLPIPTTALSGNNLLIPNP